MTVTRKSKIFMFFLGLTLPGLSLVFLPVIFSDWWHRGMASYLVEYFLRLYV